MNYSGFMGGLYGLAEWIMRLSIINLLWIITNLPILFILLLMLISPTPVYIFILSIPVAVLLPVLFFPSTIAVFANVRDWIMDKEQSSSLVKGYWKHFKGNYKKSTLSGMILTGLWVVWTIDIYYFVQQNDLLAMVMLVIGLFLFVFTIHYFSLSVHYWMKIKELLRNSFFLTIGKPLLFFVILTSNVVLFYISFTKATFLLPFFTISVSAFISFYAFYRSSLRIKENVTNNEIA